MSVQDMVEHYYKIAGLTPDPELATSLIWEEYKEWRDEASEMYKCEHNRYSAQDELKELSDLLYVIHGYALSRGWDLEEAVCRTHANNLARMFQDDGTLKRNEQGKIVKNPNTPKVSLSDLVQ